MPTDTAEQFVGYLKPSHKMTSIKAEQVTHENHTSTPHQKRYFPTIREIYANQWGTDSSLNGQKRCLITPLYVLFAPVAW